MKLTDPRWVCWFGLLIGLVEVGSGIVSYRHTTVAFDFFDEAMSTPDITEHAFQFVKLLPPKEGEHLARVLRLSGNRVVPYRDMVRLAREFRYRDARREMKVGVIVAGLFAYMLYLLRKPASPSPRLES